MYNAIKTQFVEFVGISKDALHIHVGLVIFFGLALVLRRSLGSLIPWGGLLLLECLNEVLDLLHAHSAIDLEGSLKDLLNTMFWPTLVLVVARIFCLRSNKAPQSPTTETT